MDERWMTPNIEGKEAVIAKVKNIVSDKVQKNEEVNGKATPDEDGRVPYMVVPTLDIDTSDALVVLNALEALSVNEFIQSNIDLLEDEGREVGAMFIENKYPIDLGAIMKILSELFGESLTPSDGLMISEMILVFVYEGLDTLEKLAEEQEVIDKSDKKED